MEKHIPVYSANTHCRFRHPAVGSPYLHYVHLGHPEEAESELTRRRSQPLAGTLIDPHDSDLPGAGAGPDGAWRLCREHL